MQNKLAASLDAKLVRSLTNSATSVAKNSKQLKGDKNCDAYKQTHSVPGSKVVDKQTMLTMCLPNLCLPYLLNAKSNWLIFLQIMNLSVRCIGINCKLDIFGKSHGFNECDVCI